jgi:hypothetical protein
VRGELGNDLGVVAAPEGGIQIDKVDPLRARVLPALGRSPRVTEPLLRPGAALDQLHSLSASNVDRWQQHEPIGPSRGV